MTAPLPGALRRLVSIALVAAPAAGLLACTSGGGGGAPTSGASTASSSAGGTSSSTTAASTTPTGSTTSSPPGPPSATSGTTGAGIIPCTPTVSELSVGTGLAATGQTGFLVHVRNASHQPCLTIGYPGVDLLDADGRTLAHAQRALRGHLGGVSSGTAPPQLRLEPGDEATAVVEGTDAAGAGACATATAIRFTLPDNTDSTVMTVRFPVCGTVQVHPLLAGDTGSA